MVTRPKAHRRWNDDRDQGLGARDSGLGKYRDASDRYGIERLLPRPVLIVDINRRAAESLRRAVACVCCREEDPESAVAFFDGSGRVVVGGRKNQIGIARDGNAYIDGRPGLTQTCP